MAPRPQPWAGCASAFGDKPATVWPATAAPPPSPSAGRRRPTRPAWPSWPSSTMRAYRLPRAARLRWRRALGGAIAPHRHGHPRPVQAKRRRGQPRSRARATADRTGVIRRRDRAQRPGGPLPGRDDHAHPPRPARRRWIGRCPAGERRAPDHPARRDRHRHQPRSRLGDAGTVTAPGRPPLSASKAGPTSGRGPEA